MTHVPQPSSRVRPAPRNRRGIVTLWTLLAVPLMFILMGAAIEVGRMWQARVQLENALEAAALAAVHEWAERGGQPKEIAAARTVGEMYAFANCVQGRPVDLRPESITAHAEWQFGKAVQRGTRFEFTPLSTAPQNPAVMLQASAKTPVLFRVLFGDWLAGSTVSAQTAACFDQSLNPPRARLIRVD